MPYGFGEKISARLRINNNWKGKKHSVESRKKMSEKQKEISYKIHTLESNKKRSETLKGRVISDETRKK